MIDMPTWLEMLITIVGSVVASSGFWTLLTYFLNKHDNNSDLILGLGHDRIMYLGMKYIERGYITTDEYENLYNYLYKPYEKRGGNGSAARIMREVDKLPVRSRLEPQHSVVDSYTDYTPDPKNTGK